MSLRIVLGSGFLAKYPPGGGHWTCFLQHFLGLKELGCDVYWLEILDKTNRKTRDAGLSKAFFDRMKLYGLKERCFLLWKKPKQEFILKSAQVEGMSKRRAQEIIQSADLLWNFSDALRMPFLGEFKKRVLIDVDPGQLQVSALTWNMDFHSHHVFLTVGTKIHDKDCQVPTLGLRWHRFLPCIFLPMWTVIPDPGKKAPFTSVTQWYWDEIWLKKRVLSVSKRDAYLRYIKLPRLSQRSFELAANISIKDKTGDRELLKSHDWRLVHPHRVAASPSAYQKYISRSRAEFCCPKPIHRELRSGWFSDRSAAYLAAGRPVLAEETGFSDHLPTGNGLLTFENEKEALAGIKEIDANYAHHSRAARALAVEFFDSRKVLKDMLNLCG